MRAVDYVTHGFGPMVSSVQPLAPTLPVAGDNALLRAVMVGRPDFNYLFSPSGKYGELANTPSERIRAYLRGTGLDKSLPVEVWAEIFRPLNLGTAARVFPQTEAFANAVADAVRVAKYTGDPYQFINRVFAAAASRTGTNPLIQSFVSSFQSGRLPLSLSGIIDTLKGISKAYRGY